MNLEKLKERMRKIRIGVASAAIVLFFMFLTAMGGIALALGVYMFFGVIGIIVATVAGMVHFGSVYGDFKRNLNRLADEEGWLHRSAKQELKELQKNHPRAYAICEWLARE